MDYREMLEDLINDSDGLVLTKDVVNAGIPRQYLTIFTKEDKLERVAQGVYLSPTTFDDEMYRIQAKNQRVIFSHETALYLHDLTDRDPLELTVTVPTGYNATHLKEDGLVIHTVKKSFHQLGTIDMKTMFGRDIKAYNKERTICDIIRNRKNMDPAILTESIKRYLNLKDKNIPLLLRYAKKLNIESILREYLEMLL
ncbi:type IV toxin-antitoxin system AbiEi family antitoxin domain-containing protein [Alkalibacterium putridalgicola]|uniref:type IV toxin-antitoxin system AbiEi family antitoxin domain-containing protein n=1 Tax=Alkalibacterium putridalgicola TaxID=426703 RepID=UPI0034CF48C9